MTTYNINSNSINNNIINNSKINFRNPSWLTLPTITSGDSKFIGLYAVYPDVPNGEPSNFIALNCSGNYTVDWGDGTIENFSGGYSAYHVYDYNNSSLINTNAPVSFTAINNLVQRTLHGYKNGDRVKFYDVISTSGIIETQSYYIVNTNSNDFQISTIENGNIQNLITNGSGSLLNYKQAIVTIIPQSGQNLTNIDLNIRHNQSGLQLHNAGWLDIKLGSPNLSSLSFYNSNVTNILMRSLEKIEIINCNIQDYTNLFRDLQKLRSVTINNIILPSSTVSMFQSCSQLTSVPLFDTSNVIDMNNMFDSCLNLKSIPLFNTSKVTNMSSMFSTCRSLESIPLLDTSSVTNMTSMFA